ncbi:MAG: hypothetical protein AAB538_05210 [Patescibacteria group bacterium]
MARTRWQTVAGIGIIFSVALVATPVAAKGKTNVTPLHFVSHPQAGFPEQDILVGGKGIAPGRAVRVDVKDAQHAPNLGKQVYMSYVPIPHDPFKVTAKPLGPFSRGEALGFTLGEWLAGTGSGRYIVAGDKAFLSARFQKLVPGGLYTMWCSRVKLPPKPIITDYPCGKADGSQNTLRANARGNATFNLALPPLQPSDEKTLTVVALAYHSDGQTHGADPGPFGSATHVQLFTALPAPTH